MTHHSSKKHQDKLDAMIDHLEEIKRQREKDMITLQSDLEKCLRQGAISDYSRVLQEQLDLVDRIEAGYRCSVYKAVEDLSDYIAASSIKNSTIGKPMYTAASFEGRSVMTAMAPVPYIVAASYWGDEKSPATLIIRVNGNARIEDATRVVCKIESDRVVVGKVWSLDKEQLPTKMVELPGEFFRIHPTA